MKSNNDVTLEAYEQNFDEFDMILHKIYNSLPVGGVLSFSVKDGEGELWYSGKLSAPRYFKYWNEAALRHKLQAHHFNVMYSQLASPFPVTYNTTKTNTNWHYMVCQKVLATEFSAKEKA